MTDRAAHLVDHVFPAVPVRQWVLSLPPRIRYVLAWDHALCRDVVAVYVRAVLGWLRRNARRRGVTDGRGGAVAVVQRFGAALNLNVHIHALVMDGVFVADRAGGVRFCAAEGEDAHDVVPRLATIERRIEKLLARRGVADGTAGFEAPDPPPLGRWHAREHGFDLHAGIVVPAGARDRLERLCRYALRPPLGQDRLQLTPDGKAAGAIIGGFSGVPPIGSALVQRHSRRVVGDDAACAQRGGVRVQPPEIVEPEAGIELPWPPRRTRPRNNV